MNSVPTRFGTSPKSAPKVAIIGAGVIGLGIAWRLAAKGATVDVFDRAAAGSGASYAAANNISAVANAAYAKYSKDSRVCGN